MRFLAPALLLFVPLFSFANTQFETVKTMDGGVQYCQSNADIGRLGFKLEDTAVNVSSSDANTLEFSFGPNFYKCGKGAKGFEWQPSDINEFLSSKVQTDRGLVTIAPVSYKWVVYAENYKELNPDPNITLKNQGSKYSVKISDLLPAGQKDRRNRNMASRGIVTVFLRSIRHATYPDGEVLNLGWQASSSFNIIITLPAQ